MQALFQGKLKYQKTPPPAKAVIGSRNTPGHRDRKTTPNNSTITNKAADPIKPLGEWGGLGRNVTRLVLSGFHQQISEFGSWLG